jgi:hypothetical protein
MLLNCWEINTEVTTVNREMPVEHGAYRGGDENGREAVHMLQAWSRKQESERGLYQGIYGMSGATIVCVVANQRP